MADYDLEALSLPELKKMQKDVAKAISTFEDRQKADARAKVEAFARDLGYSLAELIGHLAVAIGRLPFPEPVIRAWRRVGQERPHVDGQCEPCPSERLSQRAESRLTAVRQSYRRDLEKAAIPTSHDRKPAVASGRAASRLFTAPRLVFS